MSKRIPLLFKWFEKQLLLTILGLGISGALFGQQVPIGSWRSHLPYGHAFAVAVAESKVYCATHSGLFSYDTSTEELQRLSPIEGLAEVDVTAMAYNHYAKKLVVGYENGNIDLIDGSSIINLPFIKDKNLTGIKQINSITMLDRYAYLSCGFGIVVINLVKQEIADTYYLGSTSAPLEVLDLAFNGSVLFAATRQGVYKAQQDGPYLSDPASWQQDTSIPIGTYNTLCFFNSKIYANYSKYLSSGADPMYFNQDSLWAFDGSSWALSSLNAGYLIRKLENSENQMVITNAFGSSFYDASGARTHIVSAYGPHGEANTMQATADSKGAIWIADDGLGLVKNEHLYDYWILTPNGPTNSHVWALSYDQGDLWVATGGMSSILTNNYSRTGLHRYRENGWTSFNGSTVPALDSIYDILSVAVDPRDKEHVFAGAWGQGLLEFRNGLVTAITGPYSRGITGGIGGMEFDTKSNLWYTSSEDGNEFVNVLLAGGSTQRYAISGVSTHLGKIHTDGFGQHWVINPRSGGLLVFSEQNGGQYKFLGTGDGEGKLPTKSVTSLAEDKLGQLWLGTAKGIAVFYNPSTVFTGGNYDAQQVLVEQDGNTQYLLETETVTAIAIDGGNRKWFGTEGGGVFLMSPDGTQQIEHFTQDNSPLLSNQILSIAIDGETGEVFIGTDKGIIAYRGTATDGKDNMQNAMVFPNPVHADYAGLIGIRGLTENASVKITSIGGELVYATLAKGGQAVWDGRDKQGSKVATGIYLVFSSNPDGSQTEVSKLLFIH